MLVLFRSFLDLAHERIQTGAVELSLVKRLDRTYELPGSSPDGVGDRVGCAPGFRYEEEDQLFCAFGHLQPERRLLVFALPCLDGPDPILWRRVGRTKPERRSKKKFLSLVLGPVGLNRTETGRVGKEG